MAHWIETSNLSIYEFKYGAVVADFEPSVRELLDFCGLPWPPRCLEFHLPSRMVKTASSYQVKQPLYKSSVGRWKNYRPHLDELTEFFGEAPENEDAAARSIRTADVK